MTTFDRIDIRDYFWQFLCAVSLGLNLGMIPLVHDAQSEHYIDGTEGNELIESGFIIVDPDGYRVRGFYPDGSHERVETPAVQVTA